MSDRPEDFDLEVDIPMPGGLRVTTEMPYRILYVGDLAGGEQGTLAGPLQDGVVEVNADSFDELMAAASPSLRMKMADPLAAGGAMVELELKFDTLQAFQPANLIAQISAARAMTDLREQLVARMRGKISAEQLAAAVAKAVSGDASLAWVAESLKWTPGKPAGSPDAVDSLLGQFDLGGEETPGTPPPKSPIGAVVSAAAKGGTSIPAEEASTIRHTLAELDKKIATWLTAVLHAPPVQAIEAAWRSLAFLVSHMEFRKGLRLSVLHAPRGQLADRFRALLIDPVFDRGADAPDVIVADYPFGNTAPDMEVLDELAQHGASLPAVVLAGVSASFFGVKQAWQVATLPAIVSMFDQWQFAKWKTLRDQGYARSLAVVFGRCLLRAPYGRDDVADLEFAYRQECLAEKDLLWASGAVAVAASVARSVADTGWPTAMAGMVHGRVEGFATAMGGPKGDKKFGPTDSQLPQPKAEELAAAGVNAMAQLRDLDDPAIWNGLTAARPARMEHNAFLEVSLPYQLFAARLSVLLFALKPHLAGKSAEQIVSTVKTHVGDWLGLEGEPSPEQLQVQTGPAKGEASALQLAVTLTPPDRVLPGGIPIVLGYRLG